jgi:hypothetical protein
VVGGVGDAELYVAGDTKLQNVTITGSTSFGSNVVLNDVNFADINIQKTAFFSGIGGTSYAIYVDPPTVANSNTALKSRLYDLEVSNGAYVLGSVGIGTTNPSVKLDVIGNTKVKGDFTVTNGDLYITRTDGIGGDILANGGTDGIFGIFNTTNSGNIYLAAKNSGGTYNNTLALNSSSATINGSLNVTSDITNLILY